MKIMLCALATAGALVWSTAAQAATLSYLVEQGYKITGALATGAPGERELYLQKGKSVFVCWMSVTKERSVSTVSCLQIEGK